MPVPSGEIREVENGENIDLTSAENDASPSPPYSPTAVSEPQQNKLFVGGLNWTTNEDTLRSIFDEYGEIIDCSIMRDPQSKRSRGFGFITFKEADSVQAVLDQHNKEAIVIDEKTIDPKVAVPPKRNKIRRIFVGGLSSDTTEDDMKEYFVQFGTVEEAQLMFDRNTLRHRGFGFVTFEKPQPAEKVCSIQYHDIKGKKVEVKVAQTKEALAMQGKAARVLAQSYAAAAYNYSTSYQPYYPTAAAAHYQQMDMMYPQIMLGSKPRGKVTGGQYSPVFPYNGYGYPSGHRMPPASSPYFPSGYGGMPPFYMPDLSSMPAAALGPSHSMDYMSDQFQGMTLNGSWSPYISPTAGSPPNGYPTTMAFQGSNSYSNGDGVVSFAPPPGGLSPTTDSPPANSSYTQVPSSFNIQQQQQPAQQTAN